MSSGTVKLALPILLAFGLIAREGAAQVGGAPAQAIDYAAEEQAIRARSQQWMQAHQSKNVDAVMTTYADDAVAVYGGTLLAGRDAIRAYYVNEYAKVASERPDFVPSWQTTAVRVAQAGDMAYETGTTEDSWNAGKNRERGYFTTVWRKVGGQWKVAHDITVTVPDSMPARKPAS